jgi:hypothetical protein
MDTKIVNGVTVSYPRYENLVAMPPKIGIS